MRALDPTYGIDAPLLLHSGLPHAELEELAQQTGARGWLRKPARAAETVDAVRRALGQRPDADDVSTAPEP